MTELPQPAPDAAFDQWAAARVIGGAFERWAERHIDKRIAAGISECMADFTYAEWTLSREAWHAAREEMREAAAQECVKHAQHPEDPTNDVWSCAYRHVAEECAAAIRALSVES